MRRTTTRLSGCLFLLLSIIVFSCCQKVDLAPEQSQEDTNASGTETTSTIQRPTSTGNGTVTSPFTISELRASVSSEPVWVIGYVVGTAPRAMSNAEFAASATNQSNILLASDSLCTSADECVPVELNATSLKNAYSLAAGNNRFRQCLMLYATPSTYLGCLGLRKVTDGIWLQGFDITTIAPQNWDEEIEL